MESVAFEEPGGGGGPKPMREDFTLKSNCLW